MFESGGMLDGKHDQNYIPYNLLGFEWPSALLYKWNYPNNNLSNPNKMTQYNYMNMALIFKLQYSCQ